MNNFDIELVKLGHPVRTRSGRKVRVLCTDMDGMMPVAWTSEVMGVQVLCKAFKDGCHLVGQTCDLDLFMADRTEKRWIATWSIGDGKVRCTYPFKDKSKIDLNAIDSASYQLHEIEVNL